MNELALFAGAVGGILGGKLLGWQIVCAVELDAYAASVLAQRQNDRLLEPFPIWSDIRSFDGRPWRGIVDVISGGFPCQDISAAGKGAGIKGKRSGPWVEMARIIDEVRPRFVFVENSPMLTSRGLGRVLGDLAKMGYDARWGVLGAADVGAPHKRDRIWIIANTNSDQCAPRSKQQDKQREAFITNGSNNVANANDDSSGHGTSQAPQFETPELSSSKNASHADRARLEKRESERGNNGKEFQAAIGANWWAVEPGVGRVAHGVANRVDRLRCIGNGQVPQCAAEAWRLLSKVQN